MLQSVKNYKTTTKGEQNMAQGQALQEPFLNSLCKEQVPVSVYLVNGIKLQGQIEAFDQFVVMLKNATSQIVYKHAISTIVPSRKVVLTGLTDGHDTEHSSHD